MNKKLFLIAGAVITSAGIYSASVMAADGTGTSTARVVQALTITPGAALAFGDIVSGAPGSVAITPAGGVTDTGVTSTGTQTAGVFTVNGANDAQYSILLDGSTTIQDPVSLDTMTVGSLNHSKAPADFGTLSATGSDSLTVGGTLTLTGGETNGSYIGTYNVTVNYQ
jgi:hypothetical protein